MAESAAIAASRVALHTRGVPARPLAVRAAVRVGLYADPRPLRPRAVVAAARVGLHADARPLRPRAVSASGRPSLYVWGAVTLTAPTLPETAGGERLAALLLEVHRRTADLALALDQPEIATGAAEEARLVALLRDGGAELARRAPGVCRATYPLTVAAGTSRAGLPADVLAVEAAVWRRDVEGAAAVALRPARAEEGGALERLHRLGAVSTSAPAAYSVARGLAPLDDDDTAGAHVLLSGAEAEGGTLTVSAALANALVEAPEAPHGYELAPSLVPLAAQALRAYTLARWLAVRVPPMAAEHGAEFERALMLAQGDPARPRTGRMPYRAF
ncbi:MAG TPA: hypothetical protein VK610_04615 [Rhodothermales bacterium]|nr:hypothetical protein [Rhodothermales bacterium]